MWSSIREDRSGVPSPEVHMQMSPLSPQSSSLYHAPAQVSPRDSLLQHQTMTAHRPPSGKPGGPSAISEKKTLFLIVMKGFFSWLLYHKCKQQIICTIKQLNLHFRYMRVHNTLYKNELLFL